MNRPPTIQSILWHAYCRTRQAFLLLLFLSFARHPILYREPLSLTQVFRFARAGASLTKLSCNSFTLGPEDLFSSYPRNH
ncbi:hypothetical protein BKA60DRAFT_573613 [Fusarium oxysporum]|nr:hypothetical protein BKA60DRAFT_573613 [Fusarium oxysporum]